jgi:hypothetical protein
VDEVLTPRIRHARDKPTAVRFKFIGRSAWR